MTKAWLIGTTALVMLSSGAFAVEDHAPPPPPPGHGEEPPPPPPEGGPGHHGDWVPYDKLTLEQARKHAHEHADKLDKMTEAEWDAHKKQAMERREKWKAMTPAEREKHKEEWKAKHHGEHMEPPPPAETGIDPKAIDK